MPKHADLVERLKSAVQSASSVTAVVISDREGNVEDAEGDLDPSMAAAAAAHIARELDELGELMALGQVASLSAGGPGAALHLVTEAQTVAVVVSKQLKNAEAVCSAIARELTSRPPVAALPRRIPRGS